LNAIKKKYDDFDGKKSFHIKMVGGEGQSGDTKGEIKADMEITLSLGNDSIRHRISLKAGNSTVASLNTGEIFHKYIDKAISVSKLPKWNVKLDDNLNRMLRSFQDYSFKGIGDQKLDPIGSKRTRLAFAILDTLAHGYDESTIISITKEANEMKSLSPVISEFVRSMNAHTIAEPVSSYGTKFTIVDRKDPKKTYGILSINSHGQVQINDDMKLMTQRLASIFGGEAAEERKDIWIVNRAFTGIKVMLYKSRQDGISENTKNYIEHKKMEYMKKLSSLKNVDKHISAKVATMSRLDAMKELGIYDYCLGVDEKLPNPKLMESYLHGVCTKILEVIKKFEELY
jgi:hypothetical protein